MSWRGALWIGLASAAAVGLGLPAQAAVRDGSHDFDWELGVWKTEVRRLAAPLSGSKTWVDYQGTSVVRPVWGGKANLLELDVAGPKGRIEALSFRTYDPQAGQWRLYFASQRGGELAAPTIGGFKNGVGEFIDQELYDGRAILNRFRIRCPTHDLCHFEQAFSLDAGHTWEVNWIATDRRIGPAPKAG